MRKHLILLIGFILIGGILGYAYYKYSKEINNMKCEICGYYYKDRIDTYENNEFIKMVIPNPRPYLKVTKKNFIVYVDKEETIYTYKFNKGIFELYKDDEKVKSYDYYNDDVRLNLSEKSNTDGNTMLVNVYQMMESDAFNRMTK